MKKIFFIILCSVLCCSASFAKGILHDTAKHDSVLIRDGSSFEKAVIIVDTTEGAGVQAEYKWLSDHYPGCRSGSQSLSYHNKHPFDVLDIKTADGLPKKVYFDISNYFGRW